MEPLGSRAFVALTETHVRRGPAQVFEHLRTLAAGERVEVTGKLAGLNWYRVALDRNREGYVWGKLLRPDDR